MIRPKRSIASGECLQATQILYQNIWTHHPATSPTLSSDFSFLHERPLKSDGFYLLNKTQMADWFGKLRRHASAVYAVIVSVRQSVLQSLSLASRCSIKTADGPSAIAESFASSTDSNRRRFRSSSSSQLVIRRTRLSTVGDRAFPVADI